MDWQSEVVGQWFNCILVGDRWVDYVMMDGSVVGGRCYSGRLLVGWSVVSRLAVHWSASRLVE